MTTPLTCYQIWPTRTLTPSAPDFVVLAAGFPVNPNPFARSLAIEFVVVLAFVLDDALPLGELKDLINEISEVVEPPNTSIFSLENQS